MSALTMSSPAIALQSVGKQFDGQLVLDDINLAVEPGTFVSIVGESGCGKTTLLRLIAGLEMASTGTVTVNGQVIAGPRDGIGVVFQAPTLLKWRTALDNVLLPVQVAGQRVTPELRQAALDLMERAGLQAALHKRPHELSGGMQSRVALARALLRAPSILLLDEPFAALDVLTRERMALALLDLWEGSGPTAVFVTHDIAEAVFLSDCVIAMASRPGRLHQRFAVPFARPRTQAVRYALPYIELCRSIRGALEHVEASSAAVRR